MAESIIQIEAISIEGGKPRCSGRAHTPLGQTIKLHILTPAGFCARALHAIYPYALSMRFADSTGFEKNHAIDIRCPDGEVVFRLTRVTQNT